MTKKDFLRRPTPNYYYQNNDVISREDYIVSINEDIVFSVF